MIPVRFFKKKPHSPLISASTLACTFTLLLTSGCAGLFRSSERTAEEEAAQQPVTRAQFDEFKAVLQKLSARLETMETKLTQVGDRVELTRASIENLQGSQNPQSTTVIAHPADRTGHSIGNAAQAQVNTAEKKTEASAGATAGFVNDNAIALYRNGMIQFDNKKFSDAILTFSSFVEQFPDHALAGSAQFRVGESYYQQKEYKLALSEFQRVLTSYDRSAHVSETLSRSVELAEILKMPEVAQKNRQTLSSLFAGSPASERKTLAPLPTVRAEDSLQAASGTQKEQNDLPPTAPLTPESSALPTEENDLK